MDPGKDVEGTPEFPLNDLSRLNEMLGRTLWTVPVLPGGVLENLLNACIDMAKKGIDHKSEPCQKFIEGGLTVSFTRILTSDVMNTWTFQIQTGIFRNCEKLIELCVLKIGHHCLPLLELLAMALNPESKFHIVNASKPKGMCQPHHGYIYPDQVFASSSSPRNPKGRLVDLINHFGRLGGFEALKQRLGRQDNLTVPLISALLRPFGLASDYLADDIVQRYFLPLVDRIPEHLESLTDDELVKGAKSNIEVEKELNDSVSGIVKWLGAFVMRMPDQLRQEEVVKKRLEIFRIKMTARSLEISLPKEKRNASQEPSPATPENNKDSDVEILKKKVDALGKENESLRQELTLMKEYMGLCVEKVDKGVSGLEKEMEGKSKKMEEKLEELEKKMEGKSIKEVKEKLDDLEDALKKEYLTRQGFKYYRDLIVQMRDKFNLADD